PGELQIVLYHENRALALAQGAVVVDVGRKVLPPGSAPGGLRLPARGAATSRWWRLDSGVDERAIRSRCGLVGEWIGYREREDAADADGASHADLAAEKGGELTRDRQPQPGAAVF